VQVVLQIKGEATSTSSRNVQFPRQQLDFLLVVTRQLTKKHFHSDMSIVNGPPTSIERKLDFKFLMSNSRKPQILQILLNEF